MDVAIKTVENYSQEIVTEFLEGTHFDPRLSRLEPTIRSYSLSTTPP